MVMVIVAIPIVLFFATRGEDGSAKMNEQGSIQQDRSQGDDDEMVDLEPSNPDGTIVVEAGNGLLQASEYDLSSYVDESARGLEAYLASGGSYVIYDVVAPVTGDYVLWIKLSDDALHESGARSATIVVNNSQTKGYVHVSEDTKGWKWYEIGNVSLIEGSNSFVFTKNETTTAAFVMDEFKLIPIPK